VSVSAHTEDTIMVTTRYVIKGNEIDVPVKCRALPFIAHLLDWIIYQTPRMYRVKIQHFPALYKSPSVKYTIFGTHKRKSRKKPQRVSADKTDGKKDYITFPSQK
jgi:hypothetical protein